MDNLCHTLVGAAMGYAGLRRKTALANGTLMIAANLPDLDVLVFATDTPAIEFRRGWTHGLLAQALLPIALTVTMVAIGRWRGKAVSAPWLLALSYLGVYSHVFLDLLNNYGVRLLAPFDWSWLYGDAVFIMDPWLWLTLGVGVWVSRRRQSARPAQVALALAAIYVGGMVASARASRAIVLDAWSVERGAAPAAAMVGPVPVSPFEKQVIIDAGPHYETGQFSWWPEPRVSFNPERVPKNDRRVEVQEAQRAPGFRSFLVWSRFPFYQLEADSGGTRVSVGDMRFAGNPLRDALGRGRFTATTVVPRSRGD
jgi:inner membrane protein